MGKTFSDAFGKRDKNATNDVLNGEVVATGTPGAKTVADPNQGLNDQQMRNRKLLKLGAGFVNQVENPEQQGASPVNFAYTNTQPNMQMPQPQRYQMPFYGRMG